MENVLEIELSISDAGHTLETINMPKCIYDIDKYFGKYEIREKGINYEYINSRNIFLNRNGYRNSKTYTPEIEDVKESFRLLAKEYNITVKLWINDELQVTRGEYWQCLGNIKSIGLSTNYAVTGSIFWIAGNLSNDFDKLKGTVNGYEANALEINNEEECDVKGIEAKIMARVAVINTQTKMVNTEIIYGSNISKIEEEKRKSIIDGENIENIYSLIVDDVDVIISDKPKLKIIDSREEYCKLKSDFAYEDYLWRVGLQTKEECDVKKAEIELKLSKISDRVEYTLIWE